MASLVTTDVTEIYNQLSDKIYRFFYYKFWDVGMAEDLASETFIRFMRKVKNDEPVREPQAFVFGIAKLVYLEALKDKYKLNQTDLETHEARFQAASIDDFVGAKEVEQEKGLEDMIAPYISQLPEKQRVLIQMRLIDKAPIDEICQRLDVTKNYIKTTQNRAINNLKQMLAINPPDNE